MEMKKEMPLGVKIISVLSYIGAALGVIFGILFFAGSSMANLIFAELPVPADVGRAMLIFMGFVMIGLGILSFFIGSGLWNGQNWARITLIVLCSFGILFAIISLFSARWSSIGSLIIDGVIVYYLGFAAEVKKAFA